MNRNRCISWLLTLALMAGLFSPLSTLAPEAQAAGSLKPTAPVLDDFLVAVSQVTKVPAGYTGVYTVADLLAISDAPNDNYILMADIDLSGYQWKPLCSTYPFTGIFEGNGHVITDLNGCGGLFDSVKDGTVRNVGVENATIYPDITVYNLSPIGGIVGELRSSLGLPVVSNFYFSGNIHDLHPPASVSLSSCTMGGIVGRGLNGDLTVEYCWMKGDIVSDYLSSIIGGIVGISDTLTINGCIHMGNIRAVTQKKSSIGGICGNGYGELIDCQNWGSITYQGPEANVAGIINCSASPGPDLTRCMNAADISVTDTTKGSDNSRASKVGGLLSNSEGLYDCFNCGDIFADGCCKVGGLAGEGPRLARNCYNTGRITAVNMGRDYDGTSKFASLGGWPWDLENCFGLVRPDDTVPLLPENYVEDYLVNVRGLSESQMSSSSSFSGFDFDRVWTIGSGSYPYPVLQSMNLPDSGSGGGSTTQPSSGTIPTPVLAKAEFANKAVTVTWSLPLTVPGQTHTVDSFNILRKSGSGSSYQVIATVSGSSGGSYTDRAVIIGATYTYTVQACYQGKTGSYNAEGLTVKAQDPPGVSDDLSYEIVNGKAVITDCRETAVNVVIPAQLEGCPVVMIGTGAFQDCKKLTSVTLPDCLTVVGDHAFNGCSSLTSIDLTHVISIGKQAFAWCSELTDIRCGPDLQAIGEYALGGFNSKLVVTGYVRTPAELQCSMEGVRFRYIPADVDNTVRGTFEYSNASGNTASYSFYYSDDYFSYDNSAYHSDLAIMTLKLAMAGYSRQNLYTEELPEHDLRRALNLQRLFSDIGFGNAEFHNYNTALTDSSSKVACGFASRQIGQDVVVAVVLRGGGYGGEWADNFNVGTSGDHAGFSAAAKAVQAELEDYIAGLKGLYQFSGDVKLWMTGYSRSGATCNLLAQAMSSKIDSDNLYAYVFAAPNCTTSPKACRGLFSIISAADVVPCVPLSKWGFGRHGTTLTFPSTLPASRKDEFEKLSGIDLDDHKPVTYTIQPAAIQRFIFSLGMVVGSRSAYNDRYSDLIQQSLRAYYGTEEPLYSAEEAMANGLSISVLLPLLPDNLISLYMLDAIGRAHEPAHYLAWLEAGTLNSIRDFDASGKMVTFSSSDVTNGEVAPSGAFRDVPAGSWYYDAVQWAVENGVTSGTGPDTFSPDRACTRSEVVTLLWRALGLDELSASSAENPFRDVPTGAFYHDAVLWAAENGITTGSTPTTFSPNAVCTRSEVVTFLWRTDFPLKQLSGSMDFTDVHRNDFFCYPVKWAIEEEVTTGTSATTFSPMLTCTRAQVVTFLYRFFSR